MPTGKTQTGSKVLDPASAAVNKKKSENNKDILRYFKNFVSKGILKNFTEIGMNLF